MEPSASKPAACICQFPHPFAEILVLVMLVRIPERIPPQANKSARPSLAEPKAADDVFSSCPSRPGL